MNEEKTTALRNQYLIKTFRDEFPTHYLPKKNSSGSLNDEVVVNLSSFGTDLNDKFARLNANSNEASLTVILASISIVLGKYSSSSSNLLAFVDQFRKNEVFLLKSTLETFLSLKEIVRKVKKGILESYSYECIYNQELVEKIGSSLKLNLEDCVKVFFVRGNSAFSCNLNHEIVIQLLQNGNEFSFQYTYALQNYHPETIKRFCDIILKVLNDILTDSSIIFSDQELVTASEKNKILFQFNNTDREIEFPCSLIDPFEKNVKTQGDRVALIVDDKNITYCFLDQESNKLAKLLISNGGTVNSFVGIFMDRSIEMIVSVLAIIKAGGAYVPLDINLPIKRLEKLISKTSINVVLCDKTGANRMLSEISNQNITIIAYKQRSEEFVNKQNLKIICNDKFETIGIEKPKIDFDPEDYAYVIFTSGSTGEPKGVLLKHKPVLNIIDWVNRNFNISQNDKILMVSSLGFDLSVYDIFGGLSAGASICLATNEDRLSFRVLAFKVLKESVTFWNSAPALLEQLMPIFINSKELYLKSPLRLVFLSGDWIPLDIKDKLRIVFKNVEVVGLGGATEAAIWSNFFKINEIKEDWISIPYGRPTNNAKYLILDSNGNLSPIGVIGNLFISGDCLATGYINDVEQTHERFVQNKYFPNEIMYNTGDLARWFEDGVIEFLGRKDLQVKVRGYRIELNEIEFHLGKYDKIRDCKVICREDKNGQKILCAYYVSNDQINPSDLRIVLQKELPSYMIPSYFVGIEKIPLSSNGKVDIKSLPDPENLMNVQYDEDANEIEQTLIDIWKIVLRRSSISKNDDFFTIGGDSIKCIQTILLLNEKGYHLDMRNLYENPMINKLSSFVTDLSKYSFDENYFGKTGLIPVQHWFLQKNFKYKHHFNQSIHLKSNDILNKEELYRIFIKIIEDHDMLRACLRNDDGEFSFWISRIDEIFFEVEDYDYREFKEQSESMLANKANEIQTSLELDKPPLMKVAIFHMPDCDRLLIVIHHLVIDGVSWRILLEDIRKLYNQSKKGEKFTSSVKTTSFHRWVLKLTEYAESNRFELERNYWKTLTLKTKDKIIPDFINGKNTFRNTKRIAFVISEEETNNIMNNANKAFNTDVQDLILCALNLSLKEVFGIHRILIDFESHGRAAIFEDVQLYRTIGWFTSIYPLFFDFSSINDDLSKAIVECKDNMRKVPNNGIGFGLCKYLLKDNDSLELNAQINFNFHGEIDNAFNHHDNFSLADESAGSTVNYDDNRLWEIEISGMIKRKQLSLYITYSSDCFEKNTMTKLRDSFEYKLKCLIDFCLSKEFSVLTPGDLTYSDISMEELDTIFD